MIRILHDLNLMEGEGSGYDLIYELNALDAKKIPEIISEYDRTTVIQSAEIVQEDLLPLFDFVTQNYSLSQKNIIALGVVAQQQKLLSTELTRLLQLQDGERMRTYVKDLLKLNILVSRGNKKGTAFMVNSELVHNAKLNLKTSLKTIEPYRLKALIEEDLRLHPNSLISEIAQRLPDVDYKDLRKTIYAMVKADAIAYVGDRKYRRYSLKETPGA